MYFSNNSVLLREPRIDCQCMDVSDFLRSSALVSRVINAILYSYVTDNTMLDLSFSLGDKWGVIFCFYVRVDLKNFTLEVFFWWERLLIIILGVRGKI